MNVPYIRQTNEKGELVNKITKNNSYMAEYPSRRERRKDLQKDRFCGNGRNYSLTVSKLGKFKRIVQYEFDKEGNRKRIEHYITS